MELSNKAYRLLQQVAEKLQTRPDVPVPTSNRALNELLQWCRTHDLPTTHWLSGSQALLTAGVLAQIENLLQELHQAPIAVVRSGQSRYEQGRYSNRESKHDSRPKAGRVLVLQPDTADVQLPVLCQPAPDLALDVAVTQLDLARFAVLLVVENLDMFYQCLALHRSEEQCLPAGHAAALILFRGHQQDVRAVRELVRHFTGIGKPAVYLGDFDPAGINIALDDGYSHLLLPALDVLGEPGHTRRYPEQQQKDYERLRARSRHWAPDPVLQAYLQILLDEQRSLRHQRYRGRLESVPLPPTDNPMR